MHTPILMTEEQQDELLDLSDLIKATHVSIRSLKKLKERTATENALLKCYTDLLNSARKDFTQLKEEYGD